MPKRFFSTLSALAVLAALTVGGSFAGGHFKVETSDIQLRATMPGMAATGGYLTIHNHGHMADRLVGVSADFAAKSEIHEMIHDNGVMKMRPLSKGIEIPAGGMVMLKPGGLHLMFMGLAEPLKPGRMLEITLEFGSGHSVTVPAHVKGPADITIGKGDASHDRGHSQEGGHSCGSGDWAAPEILKNTGINPGSHSHGKLLDLYWTVGRPFAMQDQWRGDKAPSLSAEDSLKGAPRRRAVQSRPNINPDRQTFSLVQPVIVTAVEHVLRRARHVADVLGRADQESVAGKEIRDIDIKRRFQFDPDAADIGVRGAPQGRAGKGFGIG